MYLKPYNYYCSSKQFLAKAWGHGKAMGTKLDGLIGQGANMYSTLAPLVNEAAIAYGGGATKSNLYKLHEGVHGGLKKYSEIRGEAQRAGDLVERFGGAIGGF